MSGTPNTRIPTTLEGLVLRLRSLVEDEYDIDDVCGMWLLDAADLIERLERENAELCADKARWDLLESLGAKGLKWVARHSTTGRGYRLHQTDNVWPSFETAREAMDSVRETK